MKTEMNDIRQEMKAEMKDIKETLKVFTTLVMDQGNIPKSSPNYKDTSIPPEHTTVIPTNRRDPPLDEKHYTKIGGMWNIKDNISSPKFYEILVKTELKGDTAMDFKNFYNHIKMCLNAVTRLREDLLPD